MLSSNQQLFWALIHKCGLYNHDIKISNKYDVHYNDSNITINDMPVIFKERDKIINRLFKTPIKIDSSYMTILFKLLSSKIYEKINSNLSIRNAYEMFSGYSMLVKFPDLPLSNPGTTKILPIELAYDLLFFYIPVYNDKIRIYHIVNNCGEYKTIICSIDNFLNGVFRVVEGHLGVNFLLNYPRKINEHVNNYLLGYMLKEI